MAEPAAQHAAGVDPLCSVHAVVVTHRRPRLAAAAVRSLVDDEGIDPRQITVVVNPPGGLEDPALEAAVRMVHLDRNLGPAGGFRQALVEAFRSPEVQWAYLCEDDLTLLHLPAGRVRALLDRLPAGAAALGPIGAVVPFGRRFVSRSGHSVNVVPPLGSPGDLAKVDVSTWGATLVSRQVLDAGVLPDDELFFGFEDFDFFSQVRAKGLAVAVDVPCARKVAHLQTSAARDGALTGERPVDGEEPWRAYYFARNFFALARRHGYRSWLAWHLLYSVRRVQKASTWAERRAIVHGLLDGVRGRLGAHPRHLRRLGERPAVEHDPTGVAAPEPAVPADTPGVLAGRTVAMVLTHNAPLALGRCLEAIAAQTTPPAEILVVDNASSPAVDGGRPRRRSIPVTVVRSETNLGPAGGWAVAFETFLTMPRDLAWVLDDDIVPDPDCLERLLEAAAPDPAQAFCFPRSVQPDGSVGEWGSWCGFVVSRQIVAEVGVPRADLFWWAEDNEYTHWRIPKAGHPRRLVDGAVVQHDAVRQVGPVPTWKYYYEARNMLFLHLHLMRRLGWYPRNVTKLLARAVVREKGRRGPVLLAVARGLVDGARGRLGIRFPVEPMRERAELRPSAGARA